MNKPMRMLFLSATTTFVLLSSAVIGGDPRYPANTIPAELKENVNAVYREDHRVFKILARNRTSDYVHKVITILNEKGKRHASAYVGYDKLSKITKLSGTLYDALGNQVKRLKNSDIYDQSEYDGFSLYSDNRFKSIDLSHGTYPYTVEIEYEVEMKFLFAIEPFIVAGQDVSIEKGSYTIEFPAGLEPRYKARNTSAEPVLGDRDNGMKFISWQFENVKPIKVEPHGSALDVVPYITAAPSEFDYDGYAGSMNSWNEFGRWISSLNQGRNNLPEPTKEAIRNLTEPLPDKEAKIRAVYEYLQSKTRYVGIQLGIGGYQPFEAAMVDKMGYGDCKALSNYMVSMLEAIGIKAHYSLVYGGENYSPLDVDFPRTQFNHVIVMVPNGQDTVWLECTNQTNPFGYQGLFTGDRKALVITDDGAKVVNTTRYPAEVNIEATTAEVHVTEAGDAKADIRTTYQGLQYENDNLDRILNSQFEEQKKWVQQNTPIPTFDLTSFSMVQHKDRIPSAVVTIGLTMRSYANVSGKRLFLTPNLVSRSSYVPPKVESRKTNVVRRTAYIDLDTIRFHLPEEIYPEFLPEPIEIKSAFGEYQATFTVDQGSLVYTRRVRMNKGVFPPESYQELIDFYRGMMKADNTKIVFLNKT